MSLWKQVLNAIINSVIVLLNSRPVGNIPVLHMQAVLVYVLLAAENKASAKHRVFC